MGVSTNYKIRDTRGGLIEAKVDVEMYDAAAKNKQTLSQYLSATYGGMTDEGKYGSVFSQMMQNAGMFIASDHTSGIRAPLMSEVDSGLINMSAITRGDDSGRNTVSGKLLFPEIVMRAIESELSENHDDFLGGWESMIAQTESINSTTFDQPVINVTDPKGQASNPISQLSPPDALISITTSEKPYRITTKSIGMMISKEAQQAATLDLVLLATAAQARQERVRMVEEHIAGIVSGDLDRGMAALATTNSSVYDAAAVSATTMNHVAWIKYLRSNYRKRSINAIICDLDTALALEGRSGRPTRDTVFQAAGSNIGVNMTIDNLAVNDPRVLIVDDGVIAADTVVGLDTRFAIRRVVNVNADYSAIEEYVMRKGTGFRVDYGEMAHRLYDDAFSVMVFA